MSATGNPVRLSKVAREFNLGLSTVVDFLADKGHKVEQKPNTKIESDLYALLQAEFGSDKEVKEAAKKTTAPRADRETISIEDTAATKTAPVQKREEKEVMVKNLGSQGSNIIQAKAEPMEKPKVVDRNA